MNLMKRLLMAAGLVMVATTYAAASEPAPVNPPAAPAPKAQTHCPVMGGEIDSTVYTDIQGQRVYHCCPACSKKLKANPDKYFEKAAAEGVVFENIQTTCPVSGETLEDKSTGTVYKGRHIYFCCPKCEAKFAASPEEYLKKMDAPEDGE